MARVLGVVFFLLLASPAAAGVQDVLQLDPRTDTPRVVMKLDGFLTGPSRATPESVARGWARRHPELMGRKLGRLRLVQRAVAPNGLTSLVWTQVAGGVPSLDSALRAAVDARGRLVWIGGSPQPRLDRIVTKPLLSAAQALRRFTGDRLRVERVLFSGRVAWHAWIDVDAHHVIDVVVDARSGRLLRRFNRVLSAGRVKAWDY